VAGEVRGVGRLFEGRNVSDGEPQLVFLLLQEGGLHRLAQLGRASARVGPTNTQPGYKRNKSLQRCAAVLWQCPCDVIAVWWCCGGIAAVSGFYLSVWKPCLPPPPKMTCFPPTMICHNLLFKATFLALFSPRLHLFYPFIFLFPFISCSFFLFFHSSLFSLASFHIFSPTRHHHRLIPSLGIVDAILLLRSGGVVQYLLSQCCCCGVVVLWCCRCAVFTV
jgi:hypothetical protein